MTGPEHYAAAEEDLAAMNGKTVAGVNALLARAQVHATLAHAAAVIASGISVMKPTELGEWRRAMDPGYAAEVTR